MNLYLDASVVLRALLRDGPLLNEWGLWQAGVSSALTSVEVRRTLDRLRDTGAYGDLEVARSAAELTAIESSVAYYGLDTAVLATASGPMPTAVRTLDALHIATALALRASILPDLQFATHDRQQGIAAIALGFPVLGVTI